MDTLHDRLAELADHAPKGGAPAAELWARGKRAHRVRAAALAATLLVVGAVGTGIGMRFVEGDGNRSAPEPAGAVGISPPIEYPAGEELPDLGDTPGPLAAIWLAPRVGGTPEAVGLVAETGTFGTLPISVAHDDPGGPDNMVVALSADGRRMAYPSVTGELIVHDLVSGEEDSPLSEFETRVPPTWVDATHLVGHVAGGSDADGWVWEPGTAPKLVDYYDYAIEEGLDLWVAQGGSGPRPWPDNGSCSSPILLDATGEHGDESGLGWASSFEVPVLCDVLGIVPGSEILLGHWNSDRLPGDWDDPNDGNGTVVALDIRGADFPFEDPALRHVVATAGAPPRVAFASDLIGEALDSAGGAP